VSNGIILSPAEIVTLTGRRQRQAQRRELEHMGIAFRARCDGSLVVLRSDVERHPDHKPTMREPELQL